MITPKTDHIVKAAKELGGSYSESANLLSGMNDALSEYNQLYDHGYGGAGKSLISFGITMVMFPEPTGISDVLGGGVIAAGLLYNHFVPPPMYIDNIFEAIQDQVKAIHETGENLSQNYSPNVDFSSLHFEL
jgi:hypothetical protein